MNDIPVGATVDLDDEDSREAIRRFIAWLEQTNAQAVDITSRASEWLLASLLAVNGGALLAVLGSTRLPARALIWSTPWWLMGLILALLVGVLNVIGGLRAMKLYTQYIGLFSRALVVGAIENPDWEADQRSLDKFRKWPWLVGSSSAACFIAGCAMIACNLTPVSAPETGTHSASVAAARSK